MLMRAYIDFNLVPPEHAEIDRRLSNWARWCRPGSAPAVSPGFELYRSPARARTPEHSPPSAPVNGSDAVVINSLVQTLPAQQRAAIGWAYCKPVAPARQAREMGVTLEVLAWLLRDARQRVVDQERNAAELVTENRAGRMPATN
jgi:DNA-directed RNA polymerase specialized sigma24 family protein